MEKKQCVFGCENCRYEEHPTQGAEEKPRRIYANKGEGWRCGVCKEELDINPPNGLNGIYGHVCKPHAPSEERIELNMFNRDFVEGARNAGFTDPQINFLAEHFEFKTEEYE